MNNLFKNTIFFIVIVCTIGIVLNMINIFYLPKTPLLYSKSSNNVHFSMIDLENLFFLDTKFVKTISINHKKEKIKPLTKIKLRAIYENGENGFVIVEDNGSQFVNLNDKYKGYKLIKITQTNAVFLKNNEKYVLSLFSTSALQQNIIKNNPKMESYDIKIEKNTFLFYKTNLSKIWQNIGIEKVTNGYKITYLKKESIFDKMGLKIGDIIVAVNDYILRNDAQAWKLYKTANRLTQFQVVIKRNNKTKVINYEIK